MRFASCRRDRERFAAVIDGERVLPLDGVTELGTETPLSVLDAPPLRHGAECRLCEVELRPVIPRPGKIVCLGLNYRAHVEETGRELPAYPVLFTKFASSLVAAGEPIMTPPESAQVDFEGELAVVIGRAVRRAGVGEALDAVAGYSIANDVTMRDFQYRSHQWLQGKTWERSTPLGPYLVTPDEVGDAGRLDLSVRLNGELMQHSTTERMIFAVGAIVACVSEFTTLEPGDVLLTGTPGGVGYRRDPQVFLRPGDCVRVEIDRIGVLENRVVAEAV